MDKTKQLSVIQKTYDFIVWYVPIIHRFPRDYKFSLGDRLVTGLYELLEQLVKARYTPKSKKSYLLAPLNQQIELLRYQTRMLLDFKVLSNQRYEFASKQLYVIGMEVGGWLKSS